MRVCCRSSDLRAFARPLLRNNYSTKVCRGVRVQAEVDEEIVKLAEHAKAAPRLTAAEEVRTLVADEKFSTVCTLSSAPSRKGYPYGAVMPYAADQQGRIICCLSNLSGHKRDLQADGRAAVVVARGGFANMQDSRCTVTGTFTEVASAGEEAASCRAAFLAAHPDAFWADFGDFSYLRMDDVASVNLVAGFGRAAEIKSADFWAAAADPVAKFSAPVCTHMNADHMDSTIGIVKHVVGVSVGSAVMVAIDRLGMDLRCTKSAAEDGVTPVAVRIAWPEPVEGRKAVKEQLVALTRAASAGGS